MGQDESVSACAEEVEELLRGLVAALHAAMPRARNLLILTIATAFLLAGCSDNKEIAPISEDSPKGAASGSAEKAANPPRESVAPPLELVEQCYSAIKDATTVAAIRSCEGLYRHKRCKAAYQGVSSSDNDSLVRVFSECAAAYCPSFADQNLAACSGPADSSAQRYANFAELTMSVLELEWGQDIAREMSAHLVQLSTPVVSIDGDWVLLDDVEIARVEDFPPTPEWRIAPLFEALRKRGGPGAAGLQIKIRAAESTPARPLNLLIKNSAEAGYQQISFCTLADKSAEDAGGTRSVKEQCSSPTTVTSSDEPARDDKERRVVPEGQINPTVVTKRLMRELAMKKWPIERFVDRSRGVVIIGYGDLDEEDYRYASRVCGKELTRVLDQLIFDMNDRASGEYSDYFYEEMSCHNRPTHRCVVLGAADGEGMPATELRFEPRGSEGLFLDTILRRNAAHRNEKAEGRFIAKHQKRLATTTCDNAGKTTGR